MDAHKYLSAERCILKAMTPARRGITYCLLWNCSTYSIKHCVIVTACRGFRHPYSVAIPVPDSVTVNGNNEWFSRI